MNYSFIVSISVMMIFSQTLQAAPISVEIPITCKKAVSYFMNEGNFGAWENPNSDVVNQVDVNQPNQKIFSLIKNGEAIISVVARPNFCSVTLTKTAIIEGVQINKDTGAVFTDSQVTEAIYKIEALGRVVGSGTASYKPGTTSATVMFDGDFNEVIAITGLNVENEALHLFDALNRKILLN